MIGFKQKKSVRRQQPSASSDKNKKYIYRSRSEGESQSLKRSPGRPGGEEESRIARVLRSAGFTLGFLAFIAVVIYATALGSSAKVAMKGSEPPLRSTRQYADKANEILGQSLNNRWKLSIKRSDIAADMKLAFPEIMDVRVSTPIWSYKPILNITMSRPVILLVSSGGDKYLVNEEGVAMMNLRDIPGSNAANKLPIVRDETSYLVETGKNILSSEQVGFIKEIVYQTDQKKLAVSEIRLKPGGEEVHFKFDSLDYLVKFSFGNDARRSAGAFLVLKKHLDEKGPLPAEYIDLHVPERGYVR